MAKIHHLNHFSDLELPLKGELDLGRPIEELTKKDYSTLSTALLRKGEFCLLQGDKAGLDYFEMAIKLDPSNSQLFFEQGLALFEYGSHDGREAGLTLASKRFKLATNLDPALFEAWHLWGNTLYFLGIRKNEPSYFNNALKKYEKAVALSDKQSPDTLADLYWDFGDLWNKLANVSGEAADIHSAIKAYEKASSFQDDLPHEFWINFGDVYMQMGMKTNDLRFFIKAINSFKHAVSIDIANSNGWLLLAKGLKIVYGYTHDEDHFSQANECYKTAANLSSKDSAVWIDWARLLLESGTIFRDEKKLRASIDKCHKAHQLDRENLTTIAIWAETLAFLGIVTDRLENIHEALSKIEPLIQRNQDPNIFYAHGVCLTALGSYYKDADYYYQATEIFQEGLSIDRTHDRLWYGIGFSSFSSSLIDHDEESFERSCYFFERALNLRKNSAYHSQYALCLLKFGELIHDRSTFESAVFHFEEAINMQKNASYLHPEWIFSYAVSLDHLAEFLESDTHYVKAVDLLNHILTLKPEFPHLHHQLAITYSHYGELVNEPEIFNRAIHHYRIAYQREKENDRIILDWALTLVNLGILLENDLESDQYFREAEYKMIQAAKFGNIHSYYSLSCLYSLIGDLENSLRFLEKAKDFDALPILDEILEDEWLENLRDTEGFQTFIDHLAEK